MPAGNLFAIFYLHPVKNADKSEEAGRDIFEDKEFVEIRIKGQKNSTFSRPVRPSDSDEFPTAWKAFKNNQQIAIEGTPIKSLPGISPSLIMELTAVGVFTVEDIIGLNDSEIMNISGGRTLLNKCNAYMAAAAVKIEEAPVKDDDPVDTKSLEKDSSVVKKSTVKRKRTNVA